MTPGSHPLLLSPPLFFSSPPTALSPASLLRPDNLVPLQNVGGMKAGDNNPNTSGSVFLVKLRASCSPPLPPPETRFHFQSCAGGSHCLTNCSWQLLLRKLWLIFCVSACGWGEQRRVARGWLSSPGGSMGCSPITQQFPRQQWIFPSIETLQDQRTSSPYSCKGWQVSQPPGVNHPLQPPLTLLSQAGGSDLVSLQSMPIALPTVEIQCTNNCISISLGSPLPLFFMTIESIRNSCLS